MNITLTDKDFEVFVLTEFGSRHEIFLAYFEYNLDITFHELVHYILSNMCKNLNIELSILNNYINKGFLFISEYDYSEIKFLI